MAPTNNSKDSTLILQAKGGEKFEVKKKILGCVKFITAMLEGTY